MRRLVVLLSSIVALDIAFFAALAPLLPHFVSTYGLSKGEAGLLSATYAAGVLAASLPSGLAAARYGPRRAALAGVSLTAGASVAFAFADSAWMLGGARLLQGVGSALSWSGALAWLVAAAPRERRGALIGTTMGAAVFGALLGPVIGAIATVAGVQGRSRRRPARRRARRLGRADPGRARPAAAVPRALPSRRPPPARRDVAAGAARAAVRRAGGARPAAAARRRLGRRGDRRRLPRRPQASRSCSTRCSGASPTGAATCCRCGSRSSARPRSRSPSPGDVGADGRRARRRRRDGVRRLLHAGDDPPDGCRRARRDLGGAGVRGDERRLGGRQRGRAGVRRLAGRARRRRRSPTSCSPWSASSSLAATGRFAPRQLQPSSRPSSS